MRGLALEGGGARGAYHIGVVKALYENGYAFDGFVGTSIGAINAAMLAQGDFDKAIELWSSLSMDQLFDTEEQKLLQLMTPKERKKDIKTPAHLGKTLAKIIGGKGIDTTKMIAFLNQYIDEEKIRASGKDFGLVTVSLSDRKPLELMLEDIPNGRLVDYVMASASFPGFNTGTLDDKLFIDGGLYDNCPVGLLTKKGYDEIIAVRTHAPGITRNFEQQEHIKVISSRDNLGNIMFFAPENTTADISLGYYDGLRFVKNLRGLQYYINAENLEDFGARLLSLSDNVIAKTGAVLGIPSMPFKRMLFEKIIPQVGVRLKLPRDFDYTDFVLALLEYDAKEKEIDKFKVYDFEELLALAKNTPRPEKEKTVFEKITRRPWAAKEKMTVALLSNALFYSSGSLSTID